MNNKLKEDLMLKHQEVLSMLQAPKSMHDDALVEALEDGDKNREAIVHLCFDIYEMIEKEYGGERNISHSEFKEVIERYI